MHDTGCSGLVHWDDPERWDGEGGGRGVQDWEHFSKKTELKINKAEKKKRKKHGSTKKYGLYSR